MEPAIGVVDDPAHRRQTSLRIDLPRSGNLAIYGAPGAGKTTALVSLGVSLVAEHAPSDVHLYLLDFGGQALLSLSALPHVGGVVLGDEEEKLIRLLRHLIAELGRRKKLFGETGVATLSAFRAATASDLAAVVVLIDNLPALLHAYPDVEDHIAQIAQQGGTLGVHLVATAATPTLVRLRIASSFGQAMTLRLADRADYGAVLSLPEGYEPSSLAGRGLVKGRLLRAVYRWRRSDSPKTSSNRSAWICMMGHILRSPGRRAAGSRHFCAPGCSACIEVFPRIESASISRTSPATD